jgi:hypothetical protein
MRMAGKSFVGLATLLLGTGALGNDEDRQGDLNVFLRGGLSSFTGGLNDVTASGPTYGLTVNLQPLGMLGFEVGYEGSKNDLTDNRLSSQGRITRHGASALVKVSPPLMERIKPFVAAGLGASYVAVNAGAGLYRNDIMEELPIAAGVEYNNGPLTAGVRGTYRVLFDQSFARDAGAPNGSNGGLFDAALTLGARF